MVTSLTISGTAPTVGKTSQYTAGVILANSSTTFDVTTAVSWTTDKPAVAAVSTDGVVTGVSTGTAILTATYQGTTVSQQITISS